VQHRVPAKSGDEVGGAGSRLLPHSQIVPARTSQAGGQVPVVEEPLDLGLGEGPDLEDGSAVQGPPPVGVRPRGDDESVSRVGVDLPLDPGEGGGSSLLGRNLIQAVEQHYAPTRRELAVEPSRRLGGGHAPHRQSRCVWQREVTLSQYIGRKLAQANEYRDLAGQSTSHLRLPASPGQRRSYVLEQGGLAAARSAEHGEPHRISVDRLQVAPDRSAAGHTGASGGQLVRAQQRICLDIVHELRSKTEIDKNLLHGQRILIQPRPVRT